MEEKELTKIFHVKYIKMTCSLFKVYVTATRDDKNTNYSPPYDDTTAAEMLLSHICKNKNLLTKEYLSYLNIKAPFMLHQINNLTRYKTHSENEDLSSEFHAKSDRFLAKRSDFLLKVLKELTIDLFENYNKKFAKEQALKNARALLKEEEEEDLAKKMKTLADKEESVEPVVLKNIVTKQVNEKVQKMKKAFDQSLAKLAKENNAMKESVKSLKNLQGPQKKATG